MAPTGWERAIVTNHREWFRRCAVATGGVAGAVAGVPWAIGGGASRESMALVLGDDPSAIVIDGVLEAARENSARSVCVWAVDEADERAHGPAALGRGLSLGWRPRWMWVTAEALRQPADGPAGVDIVTEVEGPLPSELPYAADVAIGAVRTLVEDGVCYHFAVDGGRIVGQVAVLVTDGPVPVGVAYATGVVPAARGRGIGGALTRAAARHAFRLGVEHVGLNATPLGAPVYARLGFLDVGEGRTWSRAGDLPRTTPLLRALTEAIARDDVGALRALAGGLGPDVLDEALPCGVTPFRLAGDVGSEAAAAWVHDAGGRVDVVAAWRLGWRDRLPAIIASDPEVVGARTGPFGATALHEAAQAGDAALARLLVSAGADTTARDTAWSLTPAGWARHFGHTGLAALLDGPQPPHDRP